MNAFNVCVAIIVVLTLAGFVVGLVRAKSDEERIPAVAAFTAQVVVVAVFLVLVAGMRKSGAVPVVLAVACAVLPIAVYLIVWRACGKPASGADADGAGAEGKASGGAAAREGRSKDDVWSNLRGPGLEDLPGQAQRQMQPARTGQMQPDRAAQPLHPVLAGQAGQAMQGVQSAQAAKPAQSEQIAQAARGAGSDARTAATSQAEQVAKSSQATQPLKPAQSAQPHFGSAAFPAQSATSQAGGEVTQRFAPVTTASGIAEHPARVKDGAGSERSAAQPEQAAHAEAAAATAVLEPVRPQGAAQEDGALKGGTAQAQPAQAQPAAQRGADPRQAEKPQAEGAAQVRQAQSAQPVQHAQVQQAQAAQQAQPVQQAQVRQAQASSQEPALPDPAEPGIDEKEVARRRAAQEASRRASIAYADRKAKAEAFRSKGKYLIAAGLFEKAAETAPNKASRRTVAFEQLSCYVKAGKTDKARELAMVLRRESTLTRAERVKLNAILSQG